MDLLDFTFLIGGICALAYSLNVKPKHFFVAIAATLATTATYLAYKGFAFIAQAFNYL